MRDPRLGRGLAALLGEAHSAPQHGATVSDVPLHNLQPNPYQPRRAIRDEEVAELATSIRAHGLLQPILVRPDPQRAGHFQIIAGERRWRAAGLAGLQTITCFSQPMSDAEASAAALVENLQRQDLDPIEEAEGYRRLINDFGLTQEALGTAIGKSRSHIANLLRLLQLPVEVIDHVRAGRLSAGHARAALSCADPAAAAALIIARGLNVRQAEALAAPASGAPKESSSGTVFDEGASNLRAVESDLSQQLGLAVSISFNGRGGTISLRYQSLDQLDHVVAKLGR